MSEIYVNGFNVMVSDIEGRILFKSSIPVLYANGDVQDVIIDDVASIVINPALLKRLGASINDTIKSHEERFGEIILPSSEESNG